MEDYQTTPTSSFKIIPKISLIGHIYITFIGHAFTIKARLNCENLLEEGVG